MGNRMIDRILYLAYLIWGILFILAACGIAFRKLPPR